MRHLLFFLFLILSIPSFSQVVLGSIDFKPSRINGDAVSVIDNDSLIHLFVTSKKEINKFKFNADFSLNQRADYKAPRSRNEELAGYAVLIDGTIQLYYSNSNRTNFTVNSYKDGQQTVASEDFDFKFKDDIYLQSFTYKNTFYLLSIDRDSTLKLFTFNGASYTLKEFPMATMTFKSKGNGKPRYLHHLLTTDSAFSSTLGEVTLIDSESPNSIETVSELNKIYTVDDHLIITIDKEVEKTYVIDIDLKNMSIKTTVFAQPMNQFDSDTAKSNSFYYDGKLFQNVVSKDQLVTTITDYKSQEQLKSIEVLRDEEIAYTNSPIIQEGGAYDNYRELEKTSQLLRKMTAATPGISVYEMNGDYEITIGGSKEQNSGPAVGFGFGNAGGAIPVGGGNSVIPIAFVSVAPVWNAFNSYTTTKSTYFISMYDKQLNHLDGDVKENVFNKIEAFVEKSSPRIQTVFKFNDQFIYGYYDKREKKYFLVGFNDKS